MVSASGTLVKRLETSKEQRKTEVGEKVKFLTSSAKVKNQTRSWQIGFAGLVGEDR